MLLMDEEIEKDVNEMWTRNKVPSPSGSLSNAIVATWAKST